MSIHDFRNYNRAQSINHTSDLFNPVDFVTDYVLSKEEYRNDLDESYAVQTALEEIGAMENLYDTLSHNASGLSRPATALAVISTESICRKLGVRYTHVMPSMESMQSGYGVRLAMEGIGSKLKEMWEKFWEFIKGIFSKIASFFSSKEREIKQEKAEKKVEHIAEKVEELAHENPNAAPQQQTIEAPHIAEFLTDDKIGIEGFPAIERISKDIHDFSEFAINFNDYVLKYMKNINSSFSKVINIFAGIKEELTEQDRNTLNSISNTLHHQKVSNINTLLKKFIGQQYFLGRVFLSVDQDQDGNVTFSNIGSNSANANSGDSVKTLTLKELKPVVELLKYNIGLNKKMITEGPKKAKAIETQLKMFDASMMKLIAMSETLKDKINSEDFTKLKFVIYYHKSLVAGLADGAKKSLMIPTSAVEEYSAVVSHYAKQSLDSFMTD